MIKKILGLSMILTFGGCAAQSLPPPVQYSLPEPLYNDPEKLQLKTYTFKVYTNKELNDILKNSKGKNIVIYGMTSTGYKALTYDLIELRRYISEQKSLIVVLKKTIHERSINQ